MRDLPGMPPVHLRHVYAALLACGLQTNAGKVAELSSYACLAAAVGYTGAPGP